MRNNVEYPLLEEWSVNEIVIVSDFYLQVEQANTKGISRDELLAGYQKYLQIVPAKMLQKQLDKRFEIASGYSIYRTIEQAKKSSQKIIKIG